VSIETNKSLVRRYFEEVCNAGRLQVADELFSDDFGSPGGIRGPEAARRAAQAMRTALPDVHFRIDELVGEDDRVVAKITYTGTHRGRFLGVEPTGRTISFTPDPPKLPLPWSVDGRNAPPSD
jgi:predicted ester cyclase